MSVHPIRRWIDSFLNRGGRKRRTRADGPRLRLEALEDRTLPTAGPLDPTFGNGGTVQTNLPWDSDIIVERSVEQPDGKIVVAGTVGGLYGRDFAVERFNADGSLDASFGDGGQVHTPLLNSTDFDIGLALQSDGKIIVAGSSLNEFIVVRYNADGGMDSGFGTGGFILTALNGPADAHAAAVQADGKIVVAGGDNGGAAVVRYNADGSLDATFGVGGKAAAADLGASEDVALQSDGKIVAAGATNSFPFLYSPGNVGLVRYNTDGSLDTSFGGNGVVITPLTFSVFGEPLPYDPLGRPISEAVGPDGKIVVTDRSQGMARYNTDGSIDAGFGNGGVVAVVSTANGDPITVQAVRIDAAGRVLVGGKVDSQTWIVGRYNGNGSLDNTFGSGGQVVSSFFQGQSDAEVTDLVLNADGDVTAVGVGRQFFAPYHDLQSTSTLLARYDANGAPEASFGTNGQELVNFEGPSIDYASGVVVQPDGKVVVAIHLESTGGGIDGENDLALVRYNTDGSLDSSFGSGGVARLSEGQVGEVYSLALQSDGKIVVVVSGFTGNGTFGSRLVRFDADGSLDTAFGSNGAVALDFAGHAVTVDANGDILVAGLKVASSTSGNFSPDDFAVARFKPDGSPDTTFGGTGEVVTDFNHTADNPFAIAVQADGKIVVAGNVQLDTSPYTEQLIGLVRYNPDGSLDTTFGSGGKVTTALGSGIGVPFSGADAIALEPDGRIVVGGYADAGDAPYFLLVRYNTDGRLDTTFARGGVSFNTDLTTVEGVAVQPDGTIVAVTTGGPGLAVVSYAPDGRRDVTFAYLGPLATASGVAVGPDGKVVVAGWFGAGGASNTVVARFLDEPPPPPVFVVGTDGSLSGNNYTAAGWAPLSPAGTILSISAASDAAGGTDVFAIAASDHSLWERTFDGWAEISTGYFQQISATTDAAGRAVVFGVLGSGAGENANSLWEYRNGAWLELTGPNLAFPPFVDAPGAVQYVSAVHTAQGEVAYTIAVYGNQLYQYSSAGGWLRVSTGSFQTVSAGLNSSGQPVVYGVLSDGSLWEQNPDFGPIGQDTGWKNISGPGDPVVYPFSLLPVTPVIFGPLGPSTFLTVAAGGPDEVFAIAAWDHTLWEHSASGWQQLSTGTFANISARQTSSGVDEVFGTMADGSLWEYSNDGSSATWQELLSGGVASSAAP